MSNSIPGVQIRTLRRDKISSPCVAWCTAAFSRHWVRTYTWICRRPRCSKRGEKWGLLEEVTENSTSWASSPGIKQGRQVTCFWSLAIPGFLRHNLMAVGSLNIHCDTICKRAGLSFGRTQQCGPVVLSHEYLARYYVKTKNKCTIYNQSTTQDFQNATILAAVYTDSTRKYMISIYCAILRVVLL